MVGTRSKFWSTKHLRPTKQDTQQDKCWFAHQTDPADLSTGTNSQLCTKKKAHLSRQGVFPFFVVRFSCEFSSELWIAVHFLLCVKSHHYGFGSNEKLPREECSQFELAPWSLMWNNLQATLTKVLRVSFGFFGPMVWTQRGKTQDSSIPSLSPINDLLKLGK